MEYDCLFLTCVRPERSERSCENGFTLLFLSVYRFGAGHRYHIMALFRITVKNGVTMGGHKISKGMFVDVSTGSLINTLSNPMNSQQGRDLVASAFKYKYQQDLKKAGCLDMIHLKVEQIG